MKVTKSQLKQIIKEELESIMEFGGTISNIGGRVQDLGQAAGRREKPTENDPDSIIQAQAVEFFMNLGLDQKICNIIADNIAPNDLIIVMNKIPKIGTAAEMEDED